jgi:hypothetical protein
MDNVSVRVDQSQNTPTEMQGENNYVDDLMVSYFRLNPNNIDDKTIQKINEIGQWARSQSEKDVDIITTLKDLKYRLGSPRLGVNDVDHLYTYVSLRRQSADLEMKAKAMEV